MQAGSLPAGGTSAIRIWSQISSYPLGGFRGLFTVLCFRLISPLSVVPCSIVLTCYEAVTQLREEPHVSELRSGLSHGTVGQEFSVNKPTTDTK